MCWQNLKKEYFLLQLTLFSGFVSYQMVREAYDGELSFVFLWMYFIVRLFFSLREIEDPYYYSYINKSSEAIFVKLFVRNNFHRES